MPFDPNPLLALLAQAPPSVGQDLAPWLQTATSLGFGGLAWWLVTVQIPRMMREFREEMADARAANAKEQSDCRDAFALALAEERKGCAEERRQAALRQDAREAVVSAELARFRDAIAQLAGEVRGQGG